MTMVKDLDTGTTHKGKTPESIVRRVWGRRAELIVSPDPNNNHNGRIESMVVASAPGDSAKTILANVLIEY